MCAMAIMSEQHVLATYTTFTGFTYYEINDNLIISIITVSRD